MKKYFYIISVIFIFTSQLNSQIRSLKLGVGPSFSLNILNADDAEKKLAIGGGFDINYGAFPNLGILANFGYADLGFTRNGNSYKTSTWAFKTSLAFNLMPYSEINPYISTGIGIAYFDPKYENGIPTENIINGLYQKWTVLIPVGIGANFFLAEEFSLNLGVDLNIAMSDYLDDFKKGNADQFYTFKLGFSYYFFDKFYILRERRSKQ